MSKPRLEEIDRDYIGPPDKLSNLRPILRHEAKDETPLEQELRLKRVEVEEWNQRFWQNHNQKFIKVSFAHPLNFFLSRTFDELFSFAIFRRRKHLFWQIKWTIATHYPLIK